MKQDRLCDYIQRVKAYIKENNVELPVHKGELRGAGDSVLKGTLSSRVYLKQANVRAQTMLENRLEPLYAMLELAGAKGAYSTDHFRYMWKQLMRNHPHDSICGCSRDEVHAHMEDNYWRLETTSEDMLARGMKIAAAHLDLPGRTDGQLSHRCRQHHPGPLRRRRGADGGYSEGRRRGGDRHHRRGGQARPVPGAVQGGRRPRRLQPAQPAGEFPGGSLPRFAAHRHGRAPLPSRALW